MGGSLKENDSTNEHANIVEKEANEEQASDKLVWMDEPPAVVGHPTEFLGYRLLYYVITNSQAALQNAIAAITPKQHRHASVKVALTAKAAVTRDDCRTFFKLLAEYDPNVSKCISIGSVAPSTKVAISLSPKMPQLKHKPKQMGFLLRKLVHDVRQRALRRVFRAYRPHVSIAFLAIELAFYNVDECLHFLLDKAHSDETERLPVVIVKPKGGEAMSDVGSTLVKCKASWTVMGKRLKARAAEKFGYRGVGALEVT